MEEAEADCTTGDSIIGAQVVVNAPTGNLGDMDACREDQHERITGDSDVGAEVVVNAPTDNPGDIDACIEDQHVCTTGNSVVGAEDVLNALTCNPGDMDACLEDGDDGTDEIQHMGPCSVDADPNDNHALWLVPAISNLDEKPDGCTTRVVGTLDSSGTAELIPFAA
jgi:hypothetical protein